MKPKPLLRLALVLSLLTTGKVDAQPIPQNPPSLAPLLARWDRNHDGRLDLREINAVIEDPSVHGMEAAMAVVFHQLLRPADETNGMTLQQVLTLAGDPQTQKKISDRAAHIAKFNHALFLAGDPNLLSFKQGRMGDCYLLAAVAVFVYNHPQTARSMIKPLAGGRFEVHFGNGRDVTVGPITDGELEMGAGEGQDRGIWLAVLEQAYAGLRMETKEENTGRDFEADETVFSDFIGHGGNCAQVVLAFTGHKTTRAQMIPWVKDDPQGGLQKAHELLTTLSSQHRLMTIGTGKTKPMPKGIPHSHAFGVLAYNPATRIVRMFNPWGNNFKPVGPPGPVNGYPTEHGIFAIPLAEYVQVFGNVAYENETTTAP